MTYSRGGRYSRPHRRGLQDDTLATTRIVEKGLATHVSVSHTRAHRRYDDAKQVPWMRAAAGVGGMPGHKRVRPAVTAHTAGCQACQGVEEGRGARGCARTRSQGHRALEGCQRPSGGGPRHALYGGDQLREPEPPRSAPRLYDDVRGHPAAPG